MTTSEGQIKDEFQNSVTNITVIYYSNYYSFIEYWTQDHCIYFDSTSPPHTTPDLEPLLSQDPDLSNPASLLQEFMNLKLHKVAGEVTLIFMVSVLVKH